MIYRNRCDRDNDVQYTPGLNFWVRPCLYTEI